MNHKNKTINFIEKAKKVHRDKYDYSKVEYKTNKDKVCIICPEHGDFWQTPHNHLQNHGCPKCAGKNITTEEFIERAKAVHNNKYDYSLVEYVNSVTDVKIICPTHGVFEQKAGVHLQGHGCLKCGFESGKEINKFCTEEFIRKSKEIHGDKYDYSLVEYVNSATKVKIICPIHGVFEQRAGGHLLGYGCQQCYFDSKKTLVYGIGVDDSIIGESDMFLRNSWRQMLKRCYYEKSRIKHPCYSDCTVCEEWHRFSSFEKWGKEQYKEIGWELDKDWLLMGNRVYSPETCCFAPMEINRMISKHRHFKPEAPLGVHYHKRDKKYYVSVGYKRKFWGSFNSADEAHEVYKLEKKNKIVEMANKWKGKISDKLYNAMLNYKVN